METNEELYKQLKRLEFELKVTKADYEASEQENKELKEKKDKYYQQTLDDEILMNELSLEVDLRKKESDFYLEKLSKYRSALEEIKDYTGTCCHRFSSNHEALCYGCEFDREVCDYSIILEKINEVLK